MFYSPFDTNPYGANGYLQNYNNGMPEFKAPAATEQNIKQFIAEQVGIPVQLLEFVKLSEPLSQSAEVSHACVFSLLQIEQLPVRQLQFFDKATIEFAYCPTCLKVRYYVERTGV